ncbi:MAG: hypothetical protein V4494_06955 [Chlamydiota bacterium]
MSNIINVGSSYNNIIECDDLMETLQKNNAELTARQQSVYDICESSRKTRYKINNLITTRMIDLINAGRNIKTEHGLSAKKTLCQAQQALSFLQQDVEMIKVEIRAVQLAKNEFQKKYGESHNWYFESNINWINDCLIVTEKDFDSTQKKALEYWIMEMNERVLQ